MKDPLLKLKNNARESTFENDEQMESNIFMAVQSASAKRERQETQRNTIKGLEPRYSEV